MTELVPRNFATHLLADLEFQRAERMRNRASQPGMDWVEDVLRKAVHFVLPGNGRLFDDGRRALDRDARLPFPIVALEYAMSRESSELFGESMSPCPCRVAIGIDFRQYEARPAWFDMWEMWRSSMNLDNCILALSAARFADLGMWVVLPYGVLFDTSQFFGEAEIVNELKRSDRPDYELLQRSGWNGQIAKGAYMSRIVPLAPGFIDRVLGSDGPVKGAARLRADISDEEVAVLELIEALSCANVRADVSRPAPKLLNARRAKKRKPPIFEYRTLTIALPQSVAACGDDSVRSGRASPRIHLRRGHVRRLPDRKIWVNAAVVGSKEHGVVHKDYGLTVAA